MLDWIQLLTWLDIQKCGLLRVGISYDYNKQTDNRAGFSLINTWIIGGSQIAPNSSRRVLALTRVAETTFLLRHTEDESFLHQFVITVY